MDEGSAWCLVTLPPVSGLGPESSRILLNFLQVDLWKVRAETRGFSRNVLLSVLTGCALRTCGCRSHRRACEFSAWAVPETEEA